MKLVAKPVPMVASFDPSGRLRPLKFRYENRIITVDRVIQSEKKKIAGGNFIEFHCESTIENRLIRYQMTFDANGYSWVLVRIE
ncbi:hypothetical protein [Guggenheimella bovis]